jgi:hypothetical protein
MEDCPRCGTPLESITLSGHTAWYCEGCGFADVPVDHHGEPEDVESWEVAFNRFYDQFGE